MLVGNLMETDRVIFSPMFLTALHTDVERYIYIQRFIKKTHILVSGESKTVTSTKISKSLVFYDHFIELCESKTLSSISY